jgi:hypothetical protein
MRTNFFAASFPLAAGERFVILLPAKILRGIGTVYPVLAGVPLDIAIDVDLPPTDGGGGGSGQILGSRFDGLAAPFTQAPVWDPIVRSASIACARRWATTFT